MSINIYLDHNLNVVSIRGDLWGEFNPTLVSVGSNLDYIAPDLAAEVRALIASDEQSSPFSRSVSASVKNIGAFRHSTKSADMDCEFWQLCRPVNEGIVYLLKCSMMHTDARMDISALHLLEQADIPSFGVLQLDENWNTTYVSRTFTDIMGYGFQDVANRDWTVMLADDDVESFTQDLYKTTTSDESFQQDLRVIKKTGTTGWVSVHYKKVYDANRACLNYLLIFLDIDSQRRNQDQLRAMAEHDQLTGLGNRYALEQQIENQIRQLHPDGQFHLMYLDLDGFKAVNDGYGHSVGDQLLRSVAERLNKLCTRNDFIARLGGDEFAILHTRSSRFRIDQLVKELLSTVAAPYKLVKFAEESYISCSIGIVAVSAESIPYAHTLQQSQVKSIVDRLLSQADTAMYDAKSAGRNTYSFYVEYMNKQDQLNLKLNNALHRALDLEEFQLHYQPQWCLKNNRIYGYEALIRWPSSTASPSEFIPIAENNGLMGALGRWLIEKSFSDHAKLSRAYQKRNWRDKVPKNQQVLPQLSINISPIQFRDHRLVDFIEKGLIKHGIPAKSVTLEITESLLITDHIEIDKRLNLLKKLGLKIALDDFGTGYSSLSNLHEFPIDIIKIDRSFVSNLEQYESQQIVKAILQLGKVLKKYVVIEGVETKGQYDFCQLESEAILQGWLISQALPFIEIERFITNERSTWQFGTKDELHLKSSLKKHQYTRLTHSSH
ncbi:MAG: diguanylate cyclase/phosphodiesterase (GGDEF & EAL domains) with PAS/PAC sensor(s) [uncultured Thiotrichaceae bacterium]|uniref:Diguanylate cyclase/phosphodiesterase (GGDEF & EAL domains) with PAS/PAC sensor(S) n=1 Tax=uncultured Thiotrichaceae bacterium TaxID=298394 RepID=A0A6S6TAF9_9GAMM|nr:MAG: diguanylate cyclase/phosphodiesterase (GGDEF & EAL domains) with PAS/PAC sensor(s) [uncultured Thiotrichaceae bacterium]